MKKPLYSSKLDEMFKNVSSTSYNLNSYNYSSIKNDLQSINNMFAMENFYVQKFTKCSKFRKQIKKQPAQMSDAILGYIAQKRISSQRKATIERKENNTEPTAILSEQAQNSNRLTRAQGKMLKSSVKMKFDINNIHDDYADRQRNSIIFTEGNQTNSPTKGPIIQSMLAKKLNSDVNGVKLGLIPIPHSNSSENVVIHDTQTLSLEHIEKRFPTVKEKIAFNPNLAPKSEKKKMNNTVDSNRITVTAYEDTKITAVTTTETESPERNRYKHLKIMTKLDIEDDPIVSAFVHSTGNRSMNLKCKTLIK